MVIDAHTHVCPIEVIDALAKVQPSDEVEALRTRPFLFDWDARIAMMDRQGIDKHVIVLARPPMWLGMRRADVHRLAKLANDAIADAVRMHPDRFIGIGILPVVDDVMLDEVDRLTNELGLKGACIFTNVEGSPLDADEMWPLYDLAAERSMPLWIHPQHGPQHSWANKQMLNRLFCWPLETSLAMARLVYGGVLEKHPDLAFVTHHLGGMIPYYGGRIEAFHDMLDDFMATGLATGNVSGSSQDLTQQFKRFYNDTAVAGSDIALRCGLDYFGVDRLLFGTDFPFGPDGGEGEVAAVLRSVNDAEMHERERDHVLSENVIRLIG